MANTTLKSIVSLWTSQIERAKKSKERDFDRTAQRAWDFLGKNYKQLYLEKGEDEPEGLLGAGTESGAPFYKARRNLSREYVNLMLPYIHSRVPNRRAEPRRPPLPAELVQYLGGYVDDEVLKSERLRAWMLTWWLNYTPDVSSLTREIRTALPEGLVKGRALLWHEVMETPDGLVPGSFFGSVDDLFIDPDSETVRDAAFIVRRRRASAWKLAKDWNRDVSEFKGVARSNYAESLDSEGESGSQDPDANGKNKVQDVVEYYEIYSRMGIGAQFGDAPDDIKGQSKSLESLGPFVYLVIVPGMDAPLNLPPGIMEIENRNEMIKSALEWPIPFHQCPEDPWPCTILDFYPNQDNAWATSPLEGALPLLVFIDHLYSYIMGRIRSTCRDIIVTSAELEDGIRSAIASAKDQTVVTADVEAGELANLIHMIQFPEVNRDYWQVVAAMERAFERHSGMLPLMYGSSGEHQTRSAKEAEIREGHTTSRPNDFADMVEEWNSRIAMKEAIATRLVVPPPHGLFNEPPPKDPEDPDYSNAPMCAAWAAYINTDDPAEAASSLKYTVEAGSGRRKNRQARIADTHNLTQLMFQPFLGLAAQGQPDQYNAMIDMLSEVYEMDLSKLKFQAGMAPPPVQQGMTPQSPQVTTNGSP